MSADGGRGKFWLGGFHFSKCDSKTSPGNHVHFPAFVFGPVNSKVKQRPGFNVRQAASQSWTVLCENIVLCVVLFEFRTNVKTNKFIPSVIYFLSFAAASASAFGASGAGAPKKSLPKLATWKD